MSIEDALQKWAKSQTGKGSIQKAKFLALKQGKAFGDMKLQSSQEIDIYVSEAKRILRDFIDDASVLGRVDYNFADYLLEVNKTWDENLGCWIIDLQFDPDKIQRDSLDPEHFPEGVYDIVALLNHGYQANGHVYGYWEPAGKRIRSLDARHGSFFIQNGATYFNEKFRGEASMEWNKKYDE